MAGSKAPNRRAPHTRLPLSEKRRIVELTLRKGVSVRAISREQGVNRNSLYQWQALYRAGKLGAAPVPGARFLPVTVAPAGRAPAQASAPSSCIVQLMLCGGSTLRIETCALDADLICALVAELRR